MDHFLDVLERRGYMKLIKYIEGRVCILSVSPELKRMLRKGEQNL